MRRARLASSARKSSAWGRLRSSTLRALRWASNPTNSPSSCLAEAAPWPMKTNHRVPRFFTSFAACAAANARGFSSASHCPPTPSSNGMHHRTEEPSPPRPEPGPPPSARLPVDRRKPSQPARRLPDDRPCGVQPEAGDRREQPHETPQLARTSHHGQVPPGYPTVPRWA